MFSTPTEKTWPGVTTLYANLQTYPKFKPTVPNSHFSNELFFTNCSVNIDSCL